MSGERVLVTGGCGFIGSNLVRRLLAAEEVAVTNLDLLTYAGNPANLDDLAGHHGYRFVHGDVADPAAVRDAAEGASAILHLAAESHVDRSIEDAEAFIRTNVVGTKVIAEEARRRAIRLVHVSTDEVYGALEEVSEPAFTESTPIAPNSPYAACKASSDLLVRAWHRTYGADVVITRCSNNYGPYQFPEKFLPLMILNAMAGKPLPIYGDGLYRRDWLHVEDHCAGLVAAWRRGEAGGVYNFGTGDDRTNLSIVEALLDLVREECGATGSVLTEVPDRPGHDRRYSVDAAHAREALGWRPEVALDDGLRETVRWYRDHEAWWGPIVSGEYLVERRAAAPIRADEGGSNAGGAGGSGG